MSRRKQHTQTQRLHAGNCPRSMCTMPEFRHIPADFHLCVSLDRLVILVVRRPPRDWQTWVRFPFCRGSFFQIESYQRIQIWCFGGYPASYLAIQGQRWGWLARCRYPVTGRDRTFDLRLSQCGNTYTCLSRSVPEIGSHVAGTMINQQSSYSNLTEPYSKRNKSE